MSFDIEPDAPIHGECAAEIHRLESQLQAKDAEIEKLEAENEAHKNAIEFNNNMARVDMALYKKLHAKNIELTALTSPEAMAVLDAAMLFGKDCDHSDCGNQFDLISLRELMVCAKDAFKASQEGES